MDSFCTRSIVDWTCNILPTPLPPPETRMIDHSPAGIAYPWSATWRCMSEYGLAVEIRWACVDRYLACWRVHSLKSRTKIIRRGKYYLLFYMWNASASWMRLNLCCCFWSENWKWICVNGTCLIVWASVAPRLSVWASNYLLISSEKSSSLS